MPMQMAKPGKGFIPMKDITAKTFEGEVLKNILPVVVVIWGVG
ncbi:MAG: hypothetical protein WCD88_04695 [Desulfobacterales bacterium]